MKHIRVFLGLVLVAAGCTSVINPLVHMKPDYTDLPVEAMREVAGEIEQAVRDGNREPQIADREGIVVNDDLIVQAIRTRAARFERLDQFLDTGFAKEGRNGLVYVCRTKEYKKATTRRERDRNAHLVMNENNDRWALYESIIKAGKFPPRSLSAVQEIFHQARVNTMSKGQKFEDDSGQAVRKGK